MVMGWSAISPDNRPAYLGSIGQLDTGMTPETALQSLSGTSYWMGSPGDMPRCIYHGASFSGDLFMRVTSIYGYLPNLIEPVCDFKWWFIITPAFTVSDKNFDARQDDKSFKSVGIFPARWAWSNLRRRSTARLPVFHFLWNNPLSSILVNLINNF